MIELEDLKVLICVHECGTFSKAAKQLHVSQPSIIRTIQKIEEELQTTLFTRTKNKITFNEIGEYTVLEAQKVINQSEQFHHSVQQFISQMQNINIGSCAPSPLWHLIPTCNEIYPTIKITSQINDEDILIKGLEDDIFHLIVLSSPLNDEQYNNIKYDSESLMVTLPHDHPLAVKKSISFKDINGESILSYSSIGVWHKIHHKMLPDSHFLSQIDRKAYDKLIENSSFPSFITDISMEHYHKPKNRVIVPINDPEATLTFYLTYKKTNESRLKNLINAL